jgi:ribosomal protein S10
MYTLMFCLRRLPHLSRAEFQQYWREQHGPLVRRHASLLGIRRYVQVQTLDDPRNAALQARNQGPEAYDGVAEVWLDGEPGRPPERDTAMAAAVRAAGRELFEDERQFIDHTQSPLWVAREQVIVDGDPAAATRKLVFPLRRLPHLTLEEFQRYWRETHAPLVQKHAAAGGIVRYVQVHTLDHPSNAERQARNRSPDPYDGVAEIWLAGEGRPAAQDTVAERRGRELFEDEARFIDHARSPIWLARDHVVIAGA